MPYGTQVANPVSYSGTGGRHVILDATGRRLSSPSTCTPVCTGRTCGDDGCGGSCGACASGTCAPNGTCSAFRQVTMPGSVPQYATLGSGPSLLHVAEQASSSYSSLLYRVSDGGTFTIGTDIPGSSQGTLSKRDTLPVGAGEVPHVVSNRSSPVSGTHLLTQSGGTWSSTLAGTMQGAHFELDSAGGWHLIECSTTTVSYRSGTGGAFSSAANVVYTRPSGFDGQYCLDLTVSSAAKVSVLLVRRYWISGTNPGYRYDLGVLTNESGAWVHASIPGVSTLSMQSGQLRYDGAGTLHFLGTGGYQTRPAGGAWVMEASPMGLPTSAFGPPVQLVMDRLGVAHVAFIDASAKLVLAKRTGSGVWSLETTPLMQGLPQGPVTSTSFLGATFDAANRPWFIVDDNLNYRSITR